VFAPEPGVTSEDQKPTGNPVKVAERAVKEATSKVHSVMIVDTAGRLGIDEAMMRQAADIRKAISPHEVLFVIDAMVGQDAVTTAHAFQEGVSLTGVVLTKLDGDARGGAALSVAHVTGIPIMFASTGEKVTDLEVFHPDRMASRILDMGDVLTLIERAEETFDQAETQRLATKVAKGQDFTLDDFLSQMQQLKKMGSMGKVLSMLPGMGQAREAIENLDEKEVARTEAIIRSMTPAERDDIDLLNGSRRSRIANGSGTTVAAVNSLVKRFVEARKMMKTMAKGGTPALPGAGGFGGPGPLAGPSFGGGMGAKKGKQAKRTKAKSGNPAIRAQQEAEAARRAAERAAGGPPRPAAGSAFGLGGPGASGATEPPELPGFLGRR
jgi:signal recognition particle subunit SRP54